MSDTLIKNQYISLEEAFAFFNKRLFKDELQPCFFTLTRQKKSHGYYSHERLESRKEDSILISEISLNLGGFTTRQDIDIFSTLVHEMCHHWQATLGEPARKAYHNKEWASKMEAIGLMPSSTGEPGGKTTGQKMTHYIIKNGSFDIACKELMDLGIGIDWNSRELLKPESGKKSTNKIKYTCPSCEANAWGKPELKISCCACEEIMVVL